MSDKFVFSTPSSNPSAQAAICQQASLLQLSQAYLLVIVVSVLMSYESLGIQRRQLLCAQKENACGMPTRFPDTFPLNMSASLLVLAALIFFYRLSRQAAASAYATAAEGQRACRAEWASLLVLSAAVIRLVNLLGAHQDASQVLLV